MDSIFTHAFIKGGRLVLVFDSQNSAEYRLKNNHADKYVCAIGRFVIDKGVIFLSSIEGEHRYQLK